MNQRIEKLIQRTVQGEMYVHPVETKYDRTDLFLPPVTMSGKRVCEYILNQEPLIMEESCFTGMLTFDGSVEGDIFNRKGHKWFYQLNRNYYNQPVDNLLTFEWQHSVGDFGKIIRGGIRQTKAEIADSRKKHQGDEEAQLFLATQDKFCDTVVAWAHKCAAKAQMMAEQAKCEEYRENLIRLAESLHKVPEYPAETFYEAILSLYVCYGFIPDSIGLIDRYLYPYYKNDITKGVLTDEEATAYLQELFLMLQARIRIESDRFYRGGESHFCIGGYLPNGDDGFNELSKLIVEALMELPTWIPQISIRWTKKTPKEVFRYMMHCERCDKNKRIAFVNDEPRLQGLMEYTGVPYIDAVSYTMMGCNEIALPGGMVLGFDQMNLLRSVEHTFHNRSEDLVRAKTFEEFFRIYKEELNKDLWEVNRIGKGMQDVRSRDTNIVSNIFLEGCIERAKSCTQGGLSKYIAVGVLIGLSNAIDSLSVVKQFVYDKKIVSMEELIAALKQNWNGYEDLRVQILNEGDFFGNDDENSNGVAEMLFDSLREWNTGDNYLEKKWLFGNLIGYNEHNKFFGNATKATPDGRHDGDMMNFGIGQTDGKDHSGITALLQSVARCDKHHIMTGPSVTNIWIEESIVRNDETFEKVIDLLEAYFQMGGTHFQLNYINREDLIRAQDEPEKYKSLRVRVSGFSDYFIYLNRNLQDEIIKRTITK